MLLRRLSCLRSIACIGTFVTLVWLMSGSLYGQFENAEISEGWRERYLMLHTGRILNGPTIRNNGGYLVGQPGGQIQLSLDDVKFVFDTLHEGYCKQRDSIIEPTPATHLALANWCISYHLYDDASEEVKRCLKASPNNEAAHRLLKRLTDLIRANQTLNLETPVPRKTADGFIQPVAESIGGLSRESAQMFTSRIQPLMLNKCGNAACHGQFSTNEFKVISSRNGGHGSRQAVERNLAEVFRQIDFENVPQSKLLKILEGAHGGKGAVFTGRNSAEQMNALKNWVRTVAAERRSDSSPTVPPPLLTREGSLKIRPLVGALESKTSNPSNVIPVSAVQIKNGDSLETADLPATGRLKPDPTDAAALAREKIDKFDPEWFNQRFFRK